MTRDEAVAQIQQGLGFRSDLSDEIVSALQVAQRLLEKGRTLPGFLKQEDQVLSAMSGSAALSLPTGFIREVPGEGPRYIDSTTGLPVFLEKFDLHEAVDRFTDEDAGKPLAYVLRESTILVYPERDTTYSLIWSYWKSSVSLATNVSTNEWLQTAGAPEALIGRAGMLIADDLKDQVSYQKFEKLYATSWAGITAHDIERDSDNNPLYVGGRL